MRVLHFCNYADRVGGAEVYAHSVVEALRVRGHEVALFGASPAREIDEHGLRVIQRPRNPPDRHVLDPAARAAFDEYLDRFRPDVIHAHNLFSVGLELVERLGSCGVPLVHTVHDFQLLCPNSWCVRGDGAACPGGAGAQCFQHRCQENHPYDAWGVLLAAIRQRLASSAAVIALAPSSYLAERLRAHGWSDVRRFPYFIEFQGCSGVSRLDHELLYVGRLEKEKGVQVLLEAMPEILATTPQVRLSILGAGSQQAPLTKLAQRHKLTNAVRFLEALPRTQLPEYYARSTLCVIPSIWTENSPLVAYECLVSGLPMVGSRTGGIPELIEPGCGLTFAPGQPRDLARQVLHLLDLSRAERDHMSAAAVERSRSFDKEEHLHRLELAYGEALSRPRPKAAPRELVELLPLLHRVGSHRASSPREWIRALGRTLRLPKILPDDLT